MTRSLRLGGLLLSIALASACGDPEGATGAGAGGGPADGAGPTGAGPTGATSATGAGGDASVGSGAGTGTGTSTGTGAGAGTGAATATSTGAGGSGGESASSAGGGGEGQGGEGAGAPAQGYGAIAGSCGAIDDDDVLDPSPSTVSNDLDLTGEAPITLDDPSALTPGAQEMIADGNLGGSSLWSEVFAFEMLARCEGALLVKSEAEIDYAIEGKKTDILVSIDGLKVGVSVVRAVGFPPEDPYTVDDARVVLEGKLDDILLSSMNVAPADAWEKQILSVIAYSAEHAESILGAYELLDDETRADTILLVTTTHGDDDFIYFGR